MTKALMIRPYFRCALRGKRTGIRLGWVKCRTDRPCHEYHFAEVRWFF